MKDLTDRQRGVLRFIKDYAGAHGYPPTFREIGAHFGFLWAAARGHLKALENKGYLKVNPGVSRGIELPGGLSGLHSVPVAGRVRAGKPGLAVEDVEARISIDGSLFPHDDVFCLRVKGDSMVKAGILDGDYVIVRKQDTVKDGDIGVVFIGEEATVKRVFLKENGVILKPENERMEPLICDAREVCIVGKVIGVIRRL